MKYKYLIFSLLVLFTLTGCGEYVSLQKSTDYEYKYEAAKALYIEGQYAKASLIFGELLGVMKGTANSEESLYMLAMSNFMNKDYESASQYFRKYYQVHPKGQYVEYARYYCGYSQYCLIPDTRLDQQSTYEALKEFQDFLDLYPYTSIKGRTQQMIYALQDKLVEKEYLSAKLYYDLGTYIGNCTFGGSNYEACIVTAQNALRDFPYAESFRREELGIMILRAKYYLASGSVEEKRIERFQDMVDEFYAFRNDFPESKYMFEAQKLFNTADNILKKSNAQVSND